MRYTTIKEEFYNLNLLFKRLKEESQSSMEAIASSYKRSLIKYFLNLYESEVTQKNEQDFFKNFLHQLPKQFLGRYMEEIGKIILKRYFIIYDFQNELSKLFIPKTLITINSDRCVNCNLCALMSKFVYLPQEFKYLRKLRCNSSYCLYDPVEKSLKRSNKEDIYKIIRATINKLIFEYNKNINLNLLNSLMEILEKYGFGLDVFAIPRCYSLFRKPFYFVEIKAMSKEMTPQLSRNQKEFVKDCINREIGTLILSLVILYDENKIKVKYIEPKIY